MSRICAAACAPSDNRSKEAEMITQTAYVSEKNEATIICVNCGRTRLIGVSPEGVYKPVKAKCACGFRFLVSFEKRQHYRKETHLFGEYLKAGPDKEVGQMVVKDISRTGLRFRTERNHGIGVGDIVRVSFNLDDSGSTLISKTVEAMRIEGRMVGAKFCDHEIEKALAFYLMA